MRQDWRQAGAIFLSTGTVWVIEIASPWLLSTYPTYLMIRSGDVEGEIELAILCLIAYLAAVRWIERRVAVELSPRRAPSSLTAGFLTGIALMSLVIGILWIGGVFRPEAFGALGALGSGFIDALADAVREEILYRGLMFRLCAKVFGTWAGLLVSALWFAAWHATNPGATFVGLLSVVVGGLWLGAAYAATRQLWLPIGLHLGWNFAQGSVFGMAVSGHDIGPSLIESKLIGPTILTGGEFGPEASIVGLLVVLTATGFSAMTLARRKLAEPPIWRIAQQARLDRSHD
jgi:membrane protease YdiL (CAAX protease family)